MITAAAGAISGTWLKVTNCEWPSISSRQALSEIALVYLTFMILLLLLHGTTLHVRTGQHSFFCMELNLMNCKWLSLIPTVTLRDSIRPPPRAPDTVVVVAAAGRASVSGDRCWPVPVPCDPWESWSSTGGSPSRRRCRSWTRTASSSGWPGELLGELDLVPGVHHGVDFWIEKKRKAWEHIDLDGRNPGPTNFSWICKLTIWYWIFQECLLYSKQQCTIAFL